jgi:hypothetical protein
VFSQSRKGRIKEKETEKIHHEEHEGHEGVERISFLNLCGLCVFARKIFSGSGPESLLKRLKAGIRRFVL